MKDLYPQWDNLEHYPMAATLNHRIAAKLNDIYNYNIRGWGRVAYMPGLERYVWDKFGFSLLTILFHYNRDPEKCRIHLLVKNGRRALPPRW
jgi:hypothetical protein